MECLECEKVALKDSSKKQTFLLRKKVMRLSSSVEKMEDFLKKKFYFKSSFALCTMLKNITYLI